MNSVQHAIRTLRDQVEAALNQKGSLPAGVHLDATAVTLSFGLSLVDGPDKSDLWRLSAAGDGNPSCHSLTVQFQIRCPPGSVDSSNGSAGASKVIPTGAGILSKPADSTGAPEGRPERIARQFFEVLGPPGFDNSARATVLGECLAPLSPTETATLLAWCSTGERAPAGHPLLVPLGQIRRVLGFSPIGEAAAARILLAVLEEYPLPEILQVLGERWRFGTHWVLPGDL